MVQKGSKNKLTKGLVTMLATTALAAPIFPAGQLIVQANTVGSVMISEGSFEYGQGDETFFPKHREGAVIKVGGDVVVIEEVSDNKVILRENDEILIVTQDEEGNVFVNGEIFFSMSSVTEEDAALSLDVSLRHTWVNGGTRNFHQSFLDHSRASAVALLSLLPGWRWVSVAVTTLTIDSIWNAGRQLWWTVDRQVSSDGVWYRERSRSFSNAARTVLVRDTGWSSASRLAW